MSFERPGLNDDNAVSDTEVNEALEEGQIDEPGLNLDKVEHEDGERSPGPERDEEPRRPERDDVRRRPEGEDVGTDEQGRPVEPPD